MEQWLVTLLLSIIATTNCQLIDGPYRRGPDTTNDQLQERYIETDYYDTSNDDDRGNLQYLSPNDVQEPETATRNRQRVPNNNQLIRKGPPLQGLIYDDDGDGGFGYNYRDCKVRTLPHEEYCDVYYYQTSCNDGKALLRSCPNGLVYTGNGRNGLIGVCDYPHRADCSKNVQSADGYTDRIAEKQLHTGCFISSTTVNAQQIVEQPDPCKSKTRVVGDVEYCDRYWECEDQEPILYDCPNGLVWVGKDRGIADGCDYPWRNPTLCNNKDLANPPISTEHCDWLYGIFGHETSCTRYWTCWNGTATEQFCIGGLLYNEDTHACDWPQNVAGCQKHPLCKDDANGNVPLGKSCNRYWACQGGYPRLQRCPAMLVFDKQRKRCVAPPTADCDVPPPPPPSEDDEENDEEEDEERPFRNRNRNQGGNGIGITGGGSENRRRFQPSGPGTGQRRPSQGRPLPPQDFNLPEGAVPLNRPNIN